MVLFYFQNQIQHMNDVLVKRMIKELLIMQDQVLWAGGYHEHSEIFCLLKYKTEKLLKLYHLPYTSDMVAQIFDYPLSQAFDFMNPCRVENCQHTAKQMMTAFITNAKYQNMHYHRRYPHLWTLNEKVDWVHSNLIMLTDEGFTNFLNP